MNYFDALSVIQALVLALIEGLTEFIPVSSTGHLLLASRLMGLAESDFVATFNIAIQLGAVLAIVWLYREKLLQGFSVWKNIALAFIPIGIVAFLFYSFIRDELLMGQLGTTVSVITLALGGVVILLLEKYYFPRRMVEAEERNVQIEELSAGRALLLGVIQIISLVPGVSRSAATIFGGMGLGLNRRVATEFSFLLAIPTMLGATGYDLIQSGSSFTSDQFALLAVGFVGAFLTALVVVKLLLRFIERNTFAAFGWYRIALAVLFYFLIL